MKKIGIFVLVLLSGCSASLDDLRAMGPTERADYICEAHRDVKNLDDRISTLETNIGETETAIAQGYRLVQVCHQVPVVLEAEERCKTDDDGNKVCKKKSDLSYQSICEDKPVSIDGELERQKLERYRAELEELKQQVDTAFNACFNNVEGMSAGEAFDYYESTRRRSIF